MAGLWYAVPTSMIIGKGFPLSPQGEAECQVSITHLRLLVRFFLLLERALANGIFAVFSCFFFLSLLSLGQGETPDKNS